jgi:hypothetical protein
MTLFPTVQFYTSSDNKVANDWQRVTYSQNSISSQIKFDVFSTCYYRLSLQKSDVLQKNILDNFLTRSVLSLIYELWIYTAAACYLFLDQYVCSRLLVIMCSRLDQHCLYLQPIKEVFSINKVA